MRTLNHSFPADTGNVVPVPEERNPVQRVLATQKTIVRVRGGSNDVRIVDRAVPEFDHPREDYIA